MFISFLFLSEERRNETMHSSNAQRKKKETGAIIPQKSSRNTLRVLGFWVHEILPSCYRNTLKHLIKRKSEQTSRKCEAWASIFVEMIAQTSFSTYESEPFRTITVFLLFASVFLLSFVKEGRKMRNLYKKKYLRKIIKSTLNIRLTPKIKFKKIARGASPASPAKKELKNENTNTLRRAFFRRERQARPFISPRNAISAVSRRRM